MVGWGITYEALFSSRGTKLGAPASSLRSEGAYEDRRPVPNPASSWKSLGLKGIRERRPLSVIHCQSWSLPGPQPASREPCLSAPAWHLRAGTPRLPGRSILLPQPSCHCPSRQSHSRSEGVSLPCLPLSVPSTLYSFLTHPHRVLSGQPLCSADQRLQSGTPAPGYHAQSCLGTSCGCHTDGALVIQCRARELLHTPSSAQDGPAEVDQPGVSPAEGEGLTGIHFSLALELCPSFDLRLIPWPLQEPIIVEQDT